MERNAGSRRAAQIRPIARAFASVRRRARAEPLAPQREQATATMSSSGVAGYASRGANRPHTSAGVTRAGARQAVAPTEKKQKRLQQFKTNAGSRHAAQMGHIFAGATRAGEASLSPLRGKNNREGWRRMATATAAEISNLKFQISDEVIS